MPKGQAVEGSKSDQIRKRLLAGEPLDNATVQSEYHVNRALFPQLVAQLRDQGHVIQEKKIGPNGLKCFQLADSNGHSNGHAATASAAKAPPKPPRKKSAPKPAPAPEPAAAETVALEEPRRPLEVIQEWLLAGAALTSHEVAKELGCAPQVLQIALAQLSKQGYTYEHSDERVLFKGKYRTEKRYKITGRLDGPREPKPKSKGSRIRMPAPALDGLTEVVLVHRISDDEIDFAIRQGGRQWLAQVKSCVEG